VCIGALAVAAEVGRREAIETYVRTLNENLEHRVSVRAQELRERPEGDLLVTMNVCHDWALRSWILSWGGFARVVSPANLAAEVQADLEAARRQYLPAEAGVDIT
jgi:predicted DNA-binding transcriptional regulator YafY